MKRYLLLIIAFVVFIAHADAQGIGPVPGSQIKGTSEILGGFIVDSFFKLPVRSLVGWPYLNNKTIPMGLLQVNPLDSFMYYLKYGTIWKKVLTTDDTTTFGHGTVTNVATGYGVTGGPITTAGTISVDSMLVATRLRLQKIADSLGAIIATKGTGTITNVATGFGVLGGPITNTGTISADSTLVATRLRVQKAIDSLGAIIDTKGTGTVTSVANGYGTTGGTITAAGSIGVDSTLVATRLRVQKAVDSLNALIAAKGTGSVTSVATGYGVTGGPITTTGTINVDSSLLATRLRLQKIVDSLGAIIASKGAGTVTTLSVVSANGFAGTVANPTSTAAVTITTTVNAAAVAGNGTALIPATTTGSGSTIVLATSPALITPTLGVAVATTINKVTLTAPATGSTLTIAEGKVLTVNNSITVNSTDGVVMTTPTTNFTVARTDASNNFAGTTTVSTIAINAAITTNAVVSSFNLGTATNNSTYGFGIGASTSGNTKNINIGTGGLAGSTTPITLGSATGTSTNSLLGVTSMSMLSKLNLSTGANTTVGTSSALSSGTITVSTTAVTASSQIFLTGLGAAGVATEGELSIGTITAGTSFVINSSLTTDVRQVFYHIIN